MNIADVPVFILAGGLGTRLKEHTEFRPKPMVDVGNHPMLWHIMSTYSQYGFRRFVVCAGFKADVIKNYLLNFDALNSDFTVKIGTYDVEYHGTNEHVPWEVTVADTGAYSMTGARVAKATNLYLKNSEHFAVTYGDGLSDVNLADEFEFHKKHGKLATVLGVNPPSRFGVFDLEGDKVKTFAEKPIVDDSWINGGFFFFKRDFTKYLSTDESCVLEQAPLTKVAKDGELTMFKHKGFWACMDTQRDKEMLDAMWSSGDVPWLKEK